jgi:hypothetical protein
MWQNEMFSNGLMFPNGLMLVRIFINSLEESTMFVSVLEKEHTNRQSQLSNAPTHRESAFRDLTEHCAQWSANENIWTELKGSNMNMNEVIQWRDSPDIFRVLYWRKIMMEDGDEHKETVCEDVDWCPLAFDVVYWWTLQYTDYRSFRLSDWNYEKYRVQVTPPRPLICPLCPCLKAHA